MAWYFSEPNNTKSCSSNPIRNGFEPIKVLYEMS